MPEPKEQPKRTERVAPPPGPSRRNGQRRTQKPIKPAPRRRKS